MQLRSIKSILSVPSSRVTRISSILQTACVCPLHSRFGIRLSRLSLQNPCCGSLKFYFHFKFRIIAIKMKVPVNGFPLTINFLLIRDTCWTSAFTFWESVLNNSFLKYWSIWYGRYGTKMKSDTKIWYKLSDLRKYSRLLLNRIPLNPSSVKLFGFLEMIVSTDRYSLIHTSYCSLYRKTHLKTNLKFRFRHTRRRNHVDKNWYFQLTFCLFLDHNSSRFLLLKIMMVSVKYSDSFFSKSQTLNKHAKILNIYIFSVNGHIWKFSSLLCSPIRGIFTA